ASGYTPLMFAAAEGDAKSAASLLAAGADVNYGAPSGASALSVAIGLRKSAVADVLVAKGADVKFKDRNGVSVLHTASQLGDLEIVKKLCARGADVNAKTNQTQGMGRGGSPFRAPAGEQTPLMMAARGNHVDVMHALTEAGADPKLKAQDGSTV